MPTIKELSRMDWPTYISPTEIRLDVQLVVQVDDGIPFSIRIPKAQLSDAAIRQAVKETLDAEERRRRGAPAREIPL